MENLKTVVVGDGTVGKTCMLVSYTTNSFPWEYIPTVFDNYACNVMWENHAVNIGLWDTAGQEDYDRLRPLSYPQTDAFIVCFAIDNPNSLTNVKEKWIPEVRHHNKTAPIILVATKKDTRNDPKIKAALATRGWDCVSQETGEQVAAKMGCAAYCECSALTQDGLDTTFKTVITKGMESRRLEFKKNKKGRRMADKCSIM